MGTVQPVIDRNEVTSLFRGELPLEAKLETARTELLDLSARNRLLNSPRSAKSNRIIEIVDEKTAEIFRLMVREERPFTFLAGRAAAAAPGQKDVSRVEEEDEITNLAQPDDEAVDGRGIFRRHTDTHLQTRLTSKGLQKRLLELYSDSITLEQEQGVNILYLVLGMLRWIDPKSAANVRFAPLILIPVSLERTTASDKFRLRWRHEEQAANLSLEAYLEREHLIRLPVFESGEDFDPEAYLSGVAEAVSSKDGWEVLGDEMVLGFFSFSKFLMYRDLDPECWPAESSLVSQPLLRSLMSDGFAYTPDPIPNDALIDAYIKAPELLHIADSDSSQSVAVHEARLGRNLVIQGPPGTGKSQTIANIIAAAVADGKTVLFVAEKMVALGVVKNRLDRAGVGDACLELHSNKANKRMLLDELRRTWNLGSPKGEYPATLNGNLQQECDALNQHAAELHREHPVARMTPYEVIGELTSMLGQGHQPVDFELKGVDTWSPDERRWREELIDDLAQRVQEMGRPDEHAWAGVGLRSVLPTDVQRLIRRIDELRQSLQQFAVGMQGLAVTLRLAAPDSVESFTRVLAVAQRIAGAPPISGEALGAGEWREPAESRQIDELIEEGTRATRLAEELAPALTSSAWTAAVENDAEMIRLHLPLFGGAAAVPRLHRIVALIPKLLAEADQLSQALGAGARCETAKSIAALLQTATLIGSAPDASPEAFAASIWDYGVDQADDLAQAAATLEESRKTLDDRMTPAAWDTDLSGVRQALASHGSSVFRFVSSEWRHADRLVRSFLKDPELALPELLAALDTLAAGKKAQASLLAGDHFGRQAFGPSWRGERSAAAPLRALVVWMRSLGGVATETRLIAARLPDRQGIGEQAASAKRLLVELEPLLTVVQPLLQATGSEPAPGEAGTLPHVLAQLTPIAAAETRTRALLTQASDDIPERLAVLDRLLALQQLRGRIATASGLGSKVFGTSWLGSSSDWSGLGEIAGWVKANTDLLSLVAVLPDRKAPRLVAETLAATQGPLLLACETLLRDLQAEPHVVSVQLAGLDAAELRSIPLQDLLDRMDRWLQHPEDLSRWVGYRDCSERALQAGLRELADRLGDGRLAPADASSSLSMAYYESLLRVQLSESPDLAHFEGQIQGRTVQRFASLDRERITAAALEVVHAHHRRIPPGGGVGPVGILRGEIAKKSRHLPIRQLMQKAAPAIQALKPVLMMSPLSVAQFLPPGKLSFDMLVMDEASQIQPVDALGAIARCHQIIVVGDERQLPPTRFFAKLTSDVSESDEEDDETTRVGDVESILGLCIARGLPQRMLRWHYRSRHESLIAVSNSEFYENRLFIIPSPFTAEAAMGLRFRFVQGGIFYSESKSSEALFANPVEARAVAEAVIRHAKDSPGLTLGVATFSMKQRRAIQEQLEVLRRMNPETEAFFHGHASEPFFIKNLENVQGDERDVIFISVGYGRDAKGNFAMRFGPLGMEGGERRLNVLISRAKQRCEVFTSITDEDIDTERAKGRGIFALKLFLHFARTGRLDMTRTPQDRPSSNVFAAQVGAALQQAGYEVHPQVGIAGCFIDLAIVDPRVPGRYVLGIECDGPSYRSGRSARDRDRLRGSVLEDHGWILHRIWSVDWLHRPQEQLQHTIEAIEQARAQLTALETVAQPARAQVEIVTVEREGKVEMGLVPSSPVHQKHDLYVEAALPCPSLVELHETPTNVLAELVQQIVQIEGPIHADEVMTRLRGIWGLQRSGLRIQLAVERAIAAAVQSQRVTLEDHILCVTDQAMTVRDRSQVASQGLRRPEMLPAQEVQLAVLQLVTASFGATGDEIVRAVSRRLGYAATSAQLRSLILQQIQTLLAKTLLMQRGELFVLASVPLSTAPAVEQHSISVKVAG